MTTPASYRAFQFTKHGPAATVLQLRTDLTPDALTSTQVRVKVHSAAVNPIDTKLVEDDATWLWGLTGISQTPPSEKNPYNVGFDAAGTVVEVGADVHHFKVGDAVYTMTPFDKFGAVTEYLVIDQAYVAPKPASLTFDQAASLPLAVLTSWQALVQHGNLQAGERVLILGGSGGTGSLGVQIAKARGAYVITTTSGRNADFVKSLGADEVIDYTTQKWVDVVSAHSVDVVYDCGMEPGSWNDEAQRVLKQNTGRFVSLLDIPDRTPSLIGATSCTFLAQPSGSDLRDVTELVEKSQVTPIIDSVFDFEQCADAINKLKTGRTRGKIVIRVATE
ncbi:hypothetical protein Poli38472_014015 [Pythium oligandrum]|uniref:Enoyl reductase (ER) domain-containing protein n=1 Tax=Pythium oligandrum TaxID=41045 RepID=A0A8K1FQL2_PYTOL|nr:hypothetical protein Poli38472_014015 [Pythium oligandrum]|eukprot:TMW66703.1 hypothetical protein Poli38472_014015 [Pythium oligandrum]